MNIVKIVEERKEQLYENLSKLIRFDSQNFGHSGNEKQVAEYQEKIQKGLMTRSVAEVQGQKLQQEELDFNNYAARKQQEIQEEQVVMMNQLGDAIQTFITKYNEEKQYAMILTNSGGAPVITAAASLDITEDVLTKLNEEYIKTKNQKSE